MERNIENLLRLRRSRYGLDAFVGVAQDRVEELVRETLMYVPSAFNSQSTRIVLLRGMAHRRFWDKVCERIRGIVSEEAFEKSRRKIERGFASGAGSLLFYEDDAVVDELKRAFPLYAGDIPTYSQHTSAMHQMVLWLLLAGEGLGASLQHYDALVAEDVRAMFRLPESWRLVAQMPFGHATDTPDEKSFLPVEERFLVFDS